MFLVFNFCYNFAGAYDSTKGHVEHVYRKHLSGAFLHKENDPRIINQTYYKMIHTLRTLRIQY